MGFPIWVEDACCSGEGLASATAAEDAASPNYYFFFL